MNSKDHGQLAELLYYNFVDVRLLSTQGFELGTTIFYEYTIYMPKVQEFFVKGSLDDYDGVHQLDFDNYVGLGGSLKEAWDDFKSKVDISEFETSELADRYVYKLTTGSKK